MPRSSSKSTKAVDLEFCEPLREAVDAQLQRYLELDSACPDRLREAMQYSLLGGGKRLRPLLVLLSAEACGGTVESVLPAACAVEMIHAYSLIHDDLPAMDDDDLRRGRPTNHKVFGEATAILAGDALLTLAFEVLARDVQPPELAAQCCAELAEAAGACGMVGGQAADLAASEDQETAATVRSAALADLQSIHERKTGALLRACVRIGGMTAGAGDHQLRALDRYGSCVGLAFQIVDDLLDVRGSQEDLGKRVGKDQGRGKLTYPGVLGVEQSVRRAQELASEAVELARSFGPGGAGLETLARYILERNR